MTANQARSGCRHSSIVPAVEAARPDPVSWHVAKWGDDPFSRGSWSYLRPGGSPGDRWALAAPVDDRFVLCGEAVGTDQPAMTHGAFDSGTRAAEWCLSVTQPGASVVVIGAGLAGIGAASTLRDAGCAPVVVEARDRLGGRVHTVDLPAGDGTAAVAVDAGAAWLQQFPKNPFAALGRGLGLDLIGNDFHAPLAGAPDGAAGDVLGALEGLARACRAATRVADTSIAGVVAAMESSDGRALRFALDVDVVLETGASLADTSARWFFAEDGVGNDDHIIRGGYRAIVDHLAAGLDVRLGHAVDRVVWDAGGVVVSGHDGDGTPFSMRADRCICSLPISLLHAGWPELVPGLPPTHRDALARIGMGVVEKVLLRFAERWWPVPPSGYFRWYDTPASWAEWVDLTDVCGAPAVAALIAHEAVTREHRGRTDTEIAAAATDVLHRWSRAVSSAR